MIVADPQEKTCISQMLDGLTVYGIAPSQNGLVKVAAGYGSAWALLDAAAAAKRAPLHGYGETALQLRQLAGRTMLSRGSGKPPPFV